MKKLGWVATNYDPELEDYSKVNNKHPLYVLNRFFDVPHTILAVETIGKETFKNALKTPHPLETIKQLMKLEAQKRSQQLVFIPPLPMTEKSFIKAIGPNSSKPASWETRGKVVIPINKYYQVFSEFRKTGQAFIDEEDFAKFLSSNLQIEDDFIAKYTCLELHTLTRINNSLVDSNLLVVSIGSSGSLTTDHDGYHSDTYESWQEHFTVRDGKDPILRKDRGGIIVRKKKGSAVFDIWIMPKSKFRDNSWDPKYDTGYKSYNILVDRY
jgi:hypothetical protein